MRNLVLASIAVGTLALGIGCGTKRADTPTAATTNNNVTESKSDVDKKAPPTDEEKKPTQKSDPRLEATWDSKLHYYTEPGSPSKTGTCAVAGRVRLFAGSQDKPEKGDGTLTVMLFDCTPRSGFDEPLLAYEWHVEGHSLQSFLNEKADGAEYVFVLPWDSYKKDIAQVRLDVKFEPKSGGTLLSKSDVLTLDHSEMKEHGVD